MKILEKIKNSPFLPPIKKYYFGKIVHGTPYFMPMGFHKNIISFRKLIPKTQEELEKHIKDYPHYRNRDKFKNLPMVRRSKNWTLNLFKNWYYIEIGYPWAIKSNDLGWKDKWNSPRFEWSPAFYIFFFHWQFCIWWVAPKVEGKFEDHYWEQVLWWIYYSDKDIVKAESTWGWVKSGTKESTWSNKYLK